MSNKNSNIPVSEDQLHAYVDGLLSDDDVRLVEGYLAQHPDKMAQVVDWQRQNAAISELFPSAQAIAHAEKLSHVSATGSAPARGAVFQIAAALALVVVGTTTGWYARGTVQDNVTAMQVTLVQRAVAAHSIYSAEVLHPVEVSADQEDHLVGWLSKRLGSDIAAPDLSGSGYELVGGRLLPSGDGPAAQFMYEDPKGQRITIYAVAGSPGVLASFQFKSQDGIASVFWQDEALRYAVVGPLGREALTQLATEVYRQLI